MTNKLAIGTESNANARITEEEKQYMQEQLAKETGVAKAELGQYKTAIMVERRDANFDFLKDKTKVDQMYAALQASGNTDAIRSLETYITKYGKTSWSQRGSRVFSYPIALYQALLFTKAEPKDQEALLGDTGPCGCGVDGIYGLQTLLTSATVLKGTYPNFHGVVDNATFGYLTAKEAVVTGDGGNGPSNGAKVESITTVPELLTTSFPGKEIAKGTTVLSEDRKIFDAAGGNQTLKDKDVNFATSMQEWKVGELGTKTTFMQYNDARYVRDGSKGDLSGYYPVKMKDGKIVIEGETPPVEGETPAVEGETPAVEGETPAVEGETPPVEGEPGTAEREKVVASVMVLINQSNDLVAAGNVLKNTGNLSGAVVKYEEAVQLYTQALQKIEAHNQTNLFSIDTAELAGLKNGLEGDIQRYKEEIDQQQRQKETEQQAQVARGDKLSEYRQQVNDEGLDVVIDNTITAENVTDGNLSDIGQSIIKARQAKQELDNRAAEEKKHSERVERASDAQFGGLVSYDRSGEVFKVNIAYGIRNIVARDINSLSELQTRVQSEAQRVYTDIFSSTVSGKKQTLSTEVETDRQLTLDREENENIQSFDAGFAARKKRETVDHTSIVDEMIKYNLLGAGFLEGDINTYTGLIQDATNYTEQMITIDTEIDQQAQAMLVGTTEIIYDAENNSFTVKGVTLPRAEVMGSETSLDDIVDEANEKLTEGTSVSYDAKNNMFTYKGARVSSVDIQSADEFAIWVKEVGTQIAQQRDRLDLAEGSFDIRGLQTQITHLNTYISNPEDGFKLVDRKAEQQSNKKKKKNDTPHTPEREVSYTSLLSPHSVPLKEYITVDGIVDVPGLQKEIRGQIERVYATKSEAEQARLVSIYTAIGGVAVNLVDR